MLLSLYPTELIINTIKEEFSTSIEININNPIIKQLEDKNKILKGKIDIEKLKSILVNKIIQSVSHLSKPEIQEIYSNYYNFVKNLHEKLKS